MSFSKVKYGTEEVFTLIIEDVDGRKIGKWKVLKKDFVNVVKILINKYSLNFRVVTKGKNKDLDWAIKY